LDKSNWIILDQRIYENEHSNAAFKILMERGAVTTWPVDINRLKSAIKSLTKNYKSFKGFRYFRLRQLGRNSSSNFTLAISCFELYGTGYGIWKVKKEK
jgi:hypothetical protein